jgi:hypothetical protein
MTFVHPTHIYDVQNGFYVKGTMEYYYNLDGFLPSEKLTSVGEKEQSQSIQDSTRKVWLKTQKEAGERLPTEAPWAIK